MSISPENEQQTVLKSKVSSENLQGVTSLRNWIQNEAEFNGRTDEDFIIMFLRGCKFDVEKSKRKITKYYDTRKKLSQWWANRDLRDDSFLSVFQLNVTTIIKDKNDHHPLVAISRMSEYGQQSLNMDDCVKVQTTMIEIAMRRTTYQLNGGFWILDCRDYPLWILPYILSPTFLKNVLTSFMGTAFRILGIHILNSPAVSIGAWALIKPFTTKKVKDRVHFYRDEWPTLFDHVPIDQVPEEYGGKAGPLKDHIEPFMKEVLSYTDYLADDNKYGYN